MAARPVHWYEGQFLQPHHLQAADRAAHERTARGRWADPHGWGVRSLELDPDALTNGRLVVRELRAVFPDGTTVAAPADAVLPALDLAPLFAPGKPVTVLLALPVLNLGQPNADETADAGLARYRLTTQELEDENTGVNPQPVRVRVPNLRLLTGDQDATGYDTLPLVRLVKSSRADAPPEIDPAFSPPLLALDAWKPLALGVLGAVYDRVGRKRDRLANLIADRGGRKLDSTDVVAADHLRELSAAYAALGVLAFTPGLPPFPAYLELARLVGQLAIFDRSGRWPAIPAYDHPAPGPCFHRVKLLLDALLDILPEPEYKERAFVGVGARLQVSLDPDWAGPGWELFLGVRSDTDPDEAVRLLTGAGQLDMKVASGDRADTIFQLGQAGLSFDPTPRPTVLPELAGQRYFRLTRSPDKEWAQVVRSLTLAVRFNETRVVGALAGERTVAVRITGGSTTLRFTLYAVPAGARR